MGFIQNLNPNVQRNGPKPYLRASCLGPGLCVEQTWSISYKHVKPARGPFLHVAIAYASYSAMKSETPDRCWIIGFRQISFNTLILCHKGSPWAYSQFVIFRVFIFCGRHVSELPACEITNFAKRHFAARIVFVTNGLPVRVLDKPITPICIIFRHASFWSGPKVAQMRNWKFGIYIFGGRHV